MAECPARMGIGPLRGELLAEEHALQERTVPRKLNALALTAEASGESKYVEYHALHSSRSCAAAALPILARDGRCLRRYAFLQSLHGETGKGAPRPACRI